VSEVPRLAHACAALLEQARDLVLKLDAETYARSLPGAPGGLGAQLRHVLDFFTCLLAGLPRGTVDYDRRARDPRVESDPMAALARIESLRRALLDDVARTSDRALRVRSDEPLLPAHAGFLRSSLARELRFLASHAVHHAAVMALLLRAQGIEPLPNLGVAPSTLGSRARS
jgi:uncharacterized damage-inducible protein DinB